LRYFRAALSVIRDEVGLDLEDCSMGRTIPSWRLVVNDEIERIGRFRQFLRVEDKEIFDDLLRQCKHYAPYASTMASVVKEVPLMFSMLFGQHKMIFELEKRLSKLEANQTRPSGIQDQDHGLETLVPSSQQ
jgi:hypothetical protein